MILHRLTGMLIRRLLFFFGIFFELSLLDSITVLPIFFFLKTSKNTKGVLVNKLLFRIATGHHQQPPPPFLQLPSQLTTTTLRRCFIHQEVGTAANRGRALNVKLVFNADCLQVLCHSPYLREMCVPCPVFGSV